MNDKLTLVEMFSMAKNVEEPGVMGQIRKAAQNRSALIVGLLLGGFVPLATYMMVHHEVTMTKPLYEQWATGVVLGGLGYSAKTVYEWAKLAFHLPFKAAGFVVLLEGVMVTSSIQWLTYVALAYLIMINAVATGCRLAMKN